MSLYEKFSTDETIEKEGVWLDYGEGEKFLIARAGGANTKFVQRLQHLTKPFNRQIQMGTFSEEQGRELAAQAFAETVILTWEGVKNREGDVMDFSVANCKQFLIDLPEIFVDIREFAASYANFQTEERTEEGKS